MNEIASPLVFYPLAFLMILFGILSLKFKNIFYSLISAIMLFFLVGMLFYILGSEYNAIIQVAIYGVAVPIVLGLAIMFTNPKPVDEEKTNSNFKYFVILSSGIFVLTVIYLLLTSSIITPDSFNIIQNPTSNPRGALLSFGQNIYINYVWAFELVSIILTIVVAGLTIFNKNKEDE